MKTSKLIEKLYMPEKVEMPEFSYTTHKPIAYLIKKKKVIYKCKHCNKYMPNNLNAKTCSNCGYQIDWE